jgi:hypothetical protein
MEVVVVVLMEVVLEILLEVERRHHRPIFNGGDFSSFLGKI